MMSTYALFFILFRTKSCSSSQTAHQCLRRPQPSSSCFLLSRRSSLVDSIRGWETMKLVCWHVKGSFLQRLVWMLPMPHNQHNSCGDDSMTACLPSTYPQEARRASTEYSVCVADLSFTSCSCTCATSHCSGRCAFDVVVKALDDISGACLFQVLCLNA